jgi:hypothetical protein
MSFHPGYCPTSFSDICCSLLRAALIPAPSGTEVMAVAFSPPACRCFLHLWLLLPSVAVAAFVFILRAVLPSAFRSASSELQYEPPVVFSHQGMCETRRRSSCRRRLTLDNGSSSCYAVLDVDDLFARSASTVPVEVAVVPVLQASRSHVPSVLDLVVAVFSCGFFHLSCGVASACATLVCLPG